MRNWADVFGDEWEFIQKLGASMHDPEEKRAFWDTIRLKKGRDPTYSIYSDFPKAIPETTPVEATPTTRAGDLAQKYAPLCIAALKGNKREDPNALSVDSIDDPDHSGC